VVRPGLGVALAADGQARRLGIRGALVVGVRAGSAAERAGLRPTQQDEAGRIILGDVIVAVDGQEVSNADDLRDVLDKHKVGDRVKVTVQRGQRQVDLTMALEAIS
jgi:S1-C subfamily serine protease